MDHSLLFSLRLSFQVALIATFFVAIFGGVLAYLLARKHFAGKEALDVLLTLPLVLPPTITGYYLIVLFGRTGYIGRYLYDLTGWNIMFTWQAAVIASFVVALPLMIKTARSSIEAIDENLVNASYTLGHSELTTAARVILPLAKKGIIAGIVIAFARALGEFGATLMVAGNIPGKTETVPLAIYSLASAGEWGKTHLLVLLFTVISGLFLYVAGRLTRRLI
jgi:molybdate transport system permease protein